MSPVLPVSAPLVRCIAEGRDPTIAELFAQAEQIWLEGAANRSAFSWGQLAPASADRIACLRAAQAAMAGADPSP